MQTLRKRTSPCKYKNEPTRFLGEGVAFKAKLIGILEVEEARGDRMCQEALYELKMAVRAAGEHKQRINIVISIDGIRLRDEKTGDCLHHHPVHKISFIAQDVADSRAFGYIYGSPDTTHRFFGIKTDKAANQVVMTMRDLFQAVFDLKKREVELAKLNIEQHQLRYGSSMYLDTIPASSKLQITASTSDSTSALNIKSKISPKDEMSTAINRSVKNKTQTAGVIADLMDLELELNSLQQGLSQMERLTPSDPFGPSPSLAKEDPFGDSFTSPPCITTPPPAKLPPPPITGDRRKIGSGSGGVSGSSTHSQPELHWFDKETRDLFSSEKNSSEGENKERKDERLTTESDAKDLYDIFTELDPLGTGRSKPYTDKKDFFQELKNPPKKLINDLRGIDGTSTSDKTTSITSAASFPNSSRSLYTPQEDMEKLYDEHVRKYNLVDSECRITLAEDLTKSEPYYESSNVMGAAATSNDDPFETSFANFATFDRKRSAGETESRQSPYVSRTSPAKLSTIGGDSVKPAHSSSFTRTSNRDESEVPSIASHSDVFSQRKNQWSRDESVVSRQKIVINLRRVLSSTDDTDKENDSPVTEDGATVLKNLDAMSLPCKGGNASSDSFESIPELPQGRITSPMVSQPPPPLPPKKLQLPVVLKSSAHTTTSNSSHYDYIENRGSAIMSSPRHKLNGNVQIPPLPAPARKPKTSSFHDSQIRQRPTKQSGSSDSDYYLTPIGKSKDEIAKGGKAKPSPSLNITISQLTNTGFDDLATILRIPASKLSKMTLKELTECLSTLSIAECQKLESDMSKRTAAVTAKDKERTYYQSLKDSFDSDAAGTFHANFEEKFPTKSASVLPQIDKYAVFRELIEQEKRMTEYDRSENNNEMTDEIETTDNAKTTAKETDNDSENDKYAALRIIKSVDKETESNADETKEDEEQHAAELKPNDEKVETTSDFTSEKTKAEITEAKDATTLAEQDVSKNWAKFDSEMEATTAAGLKERKRQVPSPWKNNDDEEEEEEEEEEAIKPIRYRKQRAGRWNEDNEDDEDDEDEEAEEEEEGEEDDGHDGDYGDDSEENWESSKHSLGSSWDESSWRENGWSDRDSLYDDAETSPQAASYRERKYKQQRKGYRKRLTPPLSKKSVTEHSPWDKETIAVNVTNTLSQEWQSSPRKAHMDYSRDDKRKLRTPPRSGGASERRRYEMKEPDELTLLKMVLGKKRLKALEEQLFKHYHEQQPSQKGAHHWYAKSSSKELAADEEYASATSAKSRHQRKHYGPRPKSADKRSRSGASPSLVHQPHPDTTEELYSTPKKYASLRPAPPTQPYSHDELSISEEERWIRRSPANYKIPSSSSGRSCNHSQTSPFEDNFLTASPQPYEFADSLSETASSGHCVAVAAKGAAGKSSSRYSSGTKTPDSKHELHPYSAYEYVSGRNSRESSQRQSPFEDDFAPPSNSSLTSIKQKASDTMADVQDVFYGVDESMERSSRSGRASRPSRHEHRAKPSKYYENVEPRKRIPDAYYEKLSKDKYKYATLAATVKESIDVASTEGKSPKKGIIGGTTDARQHDPFNDNAAATATQTMPRLQNTKSKSKLRSNYDSESDSPQGEADGLGAGQLTSSSSKRKENLSTYGFSEPQQYARK